MRIRNLSQKDLEVVEKAEKRDNCVQISFINLSIVWDLNEGKEVTFIENPSQLIEAKSFVRTGIVPHTMMGTKHMQNAMFLIQNGDANLFIEPPNSQT